MIVFTGVNSDPCVEAEADTPIDRATMNQLSVDELDMMLTNLRERRLANVRKLEALAKVRADEVQLIVYLKFERALAKAQKAMQKLIEHEEKVEAVVHRVRLLAVECGL